MIRSMILPVLMTISMSAAAQKKQIKQGNEQYQKGNYQEAARAYQEALAKDPKNTTGLFNLGNALYQQKQFDAARKALGTTGQVVKEKSGKSAASYNIGNTYMHERKWKEAVEAYKQALRNNPQDPDAKYNLSYALAMLKKQQGGGGEDKKDNKGQDEKNKDQQNQDQNKQDQNKDKNKEKEEEQEQQDQRPQPQPSKLSEQQAEQLLNALQQEERKLQDKLQKTKGAPAKVEKDW